MAVWPELAAVDRIETDIDHVIVELRRRRRHREAHRFFDMGECQVADLAPIATGTMTNFVPIGRMPPDGVSMHDGDSQRHIDLTGPTGGSDDDAALDADLHHQLPAATAHSRAARTNVPWYFSVIADLSPFGPMVSVEAP